MHSFPVIHESRNLKQARPAGQYVDLLRYTLATPSWEFLLINIITCQLTCQLLFVYRSSEHFIQDIRQRYHGIHRLIHCIGLCPHLYEQSLRTILHIITIAL